MKILTAGDFRRLLNIVSAIVINHYCELELFVFCLPYLPDILYWLLCLFFALFFFAFLFA